MPLGAGSEPTAEKLIGIAALAVSIELVLFKFMPDVSTAVVQHDISALTDFAAFEREYLTPHSVHYARFLGNYLLYGLAKAIAGWNHGGDFRLHPLRIAAGILTPAYAVLGVWLPLRSASGFDWARFLSWYGLMAVIGLYVFYPADMPSLACLSIAIYCLLQGRLPLALAATVLTGLFRETSFHMIWLVAVCMVCDRAYSPRRKIFWVGAFSLTFVGEYLLVRHFFPGPLSSVAGGVNLDLRAIFLDRGFLSLTAICSLGLAVLFPAACLVRMRGVPRTDWRRGFFVASCWAFPAWLLFYRMLNGNLSEFRLLFPVLIPCIYGIAYGHSRQSGGTQVLQ